ncbi:MAG: RsmB/NOP family class I SAM-dependent RNA methyltransferase [Faecalibacterium sp.]
MGTEYFESRERALLGGRYALLYEAPSAQAARGVTVSALRTTPERFAQLADFALEPSPFCRAGFAVPQAEFRPGRHPYYHAGVFYSQEPSASSAAPLLGVRPGMRVLDLCAAPGGKSSQLAAALQGRGVLVSNEYVAARAEILKSNLERMGVPNAVILNETPARIADALPEFFDRILVDAPCSGEGMFRKEPAALAQHCEGLVHQCADLGAEILDHAAAALAPGGQMVYSTCTFAPEEDEGQVAAFLVRHPEFTLVDALGNVDYSFGSPGEENRTGGLPLDVSKVRRIWPCQGGEGHFMARLVKAGTPRALPPAGAHTAEEQLWLAAAGEASRKGKSGKKAAPVRENARSARRENARACRDAVQGRNLHSRPAGEGEVTAAQSLAAWQEFAAAYFPALAQRPAVLHGGSVLLPVPFPQTGLHVLRAGVFVGSVQKGRFVPEHHLFTAFGAQCANREDLSLADPRCVEYLSGREIEASAAADGWCCVTVDGWPLGGGKVSGGRVKNHYPKALRLL